MTGFGKKKRSRRVKRAVRKPSARLLKLCKRYGIKTTRKVGRRRVYKPVKVLKKACLKRARSIVKKLKKLKKRAASFGQRRKAGCARKSMYSRHRRSRRNNRCSAFGMMGSPFEQPAKYGFNQPVKVSQQTLSQTNSVVDNKMNSSRPDGKQLAAGDMPIYGTYREFFGQKSPTQVPPEWNFMGQPDGSLYPVGAPFYAYKTPIAAAAFGKKQHRYNVKGSGCNHLSRSICSSNPNCTYTRRGCRRRSGTVKGGLVFEGPSLQFGRSRFGVNACPEGFTRGAGGTCRPNWGK